MSYIDRIAQNIFAKAHGGGVPSEGPTGDAPLYRMFAVLALSRGTDTTLVDVHNAWAAWMAGIHPDHRSLIPFYELEPKVRELDIPYRDAIHAVALELFGE